jgi:hypothetical protein
VNLRQRAAQFVMAVAIAVTALTTVGLTAPPDWPFSLRIRPVLLRVDAASIAESRASALGFDVDITIGSLQFHFSWSAIPLFRSTKGDSRTL